MHNEIIVRTVSGVTLGLVVLAITWFGGLAFKLLIVLIMLLLLLEWFRIVASRSLSAVCWAIGSAVIAVTGLFILLGWYGLGIAASASGAVALALVRALEKDDFWPSVGIVYAGFFGVAFTALRDSGEYGFAAIIFLFAVVWTTDIFAFFGGRRFGGPKLAPVLSPKKTWSGFLCGLVGGVLAGSIAAAFLTGSSFGWVAMLAVIVSVSGQIGDLFESAFKRRFGAKDSSGLIPGHGGVMDRMDSVVFAAFSAYIVAVTVPGGSQAPVGSNGIAIHLLGP